MASQPAELLSLARPSGVLLEPEFLVPESGIVTAAPAALIAWAHRARPMEACIYARAVTLPRWGCAVAATARMLSDAGIVQLSQSRPSAVLPFHYLARRTRKAMTIDMPAPKAARAGGELSFDAERLLELLSGYARRGDACPTNNVIALRLGLPKGSICGLLNSLARAQLIKVTPGEWPARIVEICDTGLRTAGMTGGAR